MTDQRLKQYERQLRRLLAQIQRVATLLEGETRVSTGGEASDGLSNTPLHLGDGGSNAYAQELSATLLETETRLLGEVRAALERIEHGTFGVCAGCGRNVPGERLTIVPYTRFCVRCSENHQLAPVNMNDGRPRDWSLDFRPRAGQSKAAGTPGDY